ncbi:sel1 repeat family protein [Sneathiella glossodoripedis]|uniref:sel1 repeat family protein n=1 Tax=Sneathiella glossodoripedis TaxID=418853 RepID=UPI000470522A|nr:sel1 repeat family protein [Sneathiella glossodoripedis]
MAELDRDYLSKLTAKADAGSPEEQYRAGLRFAMGDGVPVDLVTAHKWLNLAAMNGVVEARESRAEISMDMSPQEIAVAQKLAREWYLTH